MLPDFSKKAKHQMKRNRSETARFSILGQVASLLTLPAALEAASNARIIWKGGVGVLAK